MCISYYHAKVTFPFLLSWIPHHPSPLPIFNSFRKANFVLVVCDFQQLGQLSLQVMMTLVNYCQFFSAPILSRIYTTKYFNQGSLVVLRTSGSNLDLSSFSHLILALALAQVLTSTRLVRTMNFEVVTTLNNHMDTGLSMASLELSCQCAWVLLDYSYNQREVS